MERGVRFEAELLLDQLSSAQVIDCTTDQDSTQHLLLAKPGEILYQPVFTVPAAFYPEALKRTGVEFTIFRPDFLWIQEHAPTGQRLILIIDAKVIYPDLICNLLFVF